MIQKLLIEVAFLMTLLERFGVPISQWGQGLAKSVGNLQKELEEGESYLKIDSSGIARIVEIVKMDVLDPENPKRGHLLEWEQTLPDGRLRERRQVPAGKMKGGESPEDSLYREIHEELQLGRTDFSFISKGTTLESKPSRSYPGLACKYIVHHFEIFPNAGSPVLRDEFSITDPEGVTLRFRWENLTK